MANLLSLPLLPVQVELPPVAAPPPRSVRLSLTDRCDLACVYCRPSRRDGYLDDRLDDAAWRTLIAGLVARGVRRVRLTGGEPLLYPRVVEMVAYVASLGVDDLALTTNGTRLAELAGPLRAAGLRRLTLSLDSLDPSRFFRLTRGGRLAEVLEGFEAARLAGFDELKTNTVVLRDDNDDELAAIVRFAWARGAVPRFIELMPIAEGARLPADKLVTVTEMRARLAHLLAPDFARTDPDRGPARYVRAERDAALRVGFISGASDTFCAACDRLRVASDGVLRPCLATDVGVSARAAARAGDAASVGEAVDAAWAVKPDGATWKGCTEKSAARVSMRAIGG